MKKILVATLAIALAASAAQAASKKKAEEAPAEPAFKTALNVAATLTDGNSETMGVNASLVTEGEKEGLGSIIAGIEGNYAENTVKTVDSEGNVHKSDDTTVENAKAYVNVKKTLTEMTFVGLNASGEYDDIAAIDYRFTLGPSLGFYAIKSDRQSLSLEAGPSYVWEKLDGETDDYLALRFAERYEIHLTKTASLVQSLEYLPKIDDFDRYLLNAEVALDVAINDRLSLRFVVQDSYNSEPAADADENDLSLLAGFGFKL